MKKSEAKAEGARQGFGSRVSISTSMTVVLSSRAAIERMSGVRLGAGEGDTAGPGGTREAVGRRFTGGAVEEVGGSKTGAEVGGGARRVV